MIQVPFFVSVIFFITIIATVFLFINASKRRAPQVLFIIGGLMLFQGIVATSGFYEITNTIPPRLVLLVFPSVVLILYSLFSEKGKAWIADLDLKKLTLMHVVRVPVEIVLYWLYCYKTIPQIMTFEGRNWDILSGITAIFVFIFYEKLSKNALIVWNFLCLGLVLNIVAHGILSVATPFQQFGFEQPNIALGYVPFCYLPSVIVALVLLAHIVVIRRLRNSL